MVCRAAAAGRVARQVDPELLLRAFVFVPQSKLTESNMGRGLLLWLIGIPIPIILLVWLFGGLH